MLDTPFHLYLSPRQSTGVIFASPHSGRNYPWSFVRQTVLDERVIRSSEDAFVDQLYQAAPQLGAPLLVAGAPRAYVDLNRDCHELDPAVIEDAPKIASNSRIASGLGVIPRVVAGGRAIYRGKLDMQEAERRLNHIWHPYHQKLGQLMTSAAERYGQGILIDCHSMPAEALRGTTRKGAPQPDIILGDRFGSSADPAIMDAVEAAYRNVGFNVTRNSPFSGAYIVKRYGKPQKNFHAIQVEINRALYMNESLIRPNGDFEIIQTKLTSVMRDVIKLGRSARPMAAE